MVQLPDTFIWAAPSWSGGWDEARAGVALGDRNPAARDNLLPMEPAVVGGDTGRAEWLVSGGAGVPGVRAVFPKKPIRPLIISPMEERKGVDLFRGW